MSDFHFKTRHAISILVILLIVVFLFEPSIFGTMINTLLGRFTLLFILILITKYNTLFGLISVLLIIALYEYYNRFEGMENLALEKPATPPVKKEEVQPNESGVVSTPASIPDTEPVKPSIDASKSINPGQKSDLEAKVLKGNNSKELHNSNITKSSDAITASESTNVNKLSEGFASMFGTSYSTF